MNTPFLLPCPFCGRIARLKEQAGWFIAGCEACGINTELRLIQSEAARAWNKRTDIDHIAMGRVMKRYRVEAGLSCQEMAKRLNWSAQYVSDLERGRSCWTMNKVKQLALRAIEETVSHFSIRIIAFGWKLVFGPAERGLFRWSTIKTKKCTFQCWKKVYP